MSLEASMAEVSTEEILNLGRPVPRNEAHVFASTRTGPFDPSVRVRCPILRFAPRKTQVCLKCPHYKGLRDRVIHGEIDKNNPIDASNSYMIQCAYPITRGLVWVPEE